MSETTSQRKFDALVDWCVELIEREKAPGFLVGISGTDSIVAFMVCARAFEKLGRPDRVVGIHYGLPFPPTNRNAGEIDRILAASPSYRWVSRIIVPWLREQVPGSTIVVDDSIDVASDHARWAALFTKAINNAPDKDVYDGESALWVVGTRNATEDALGTYSNISSAVSLQPLLRLWKTEIIEICEWLGVPSIAIEHSRQADCDCGRFDLAAAHIPEIDIILQERLRPQRNTKAIELQKSLKPEVWSRLVAFVAEQVSSGGFKKRIPYLPPESLPYGARAYSERRKRVESDRIIASVHGRIEYLGEEFPFWRFLTQSVGGPSLVERYGLRRLNRPTDLRDPKLSDPDRDEFGVGFCFEYTGHYVEYRRAYIAASLSGVSPVTIIIRNNSPYFGRDRLPEAAYVSFQPISVDALQAVTPETFKPGGMFTPLSDIDLHTGAGFDKVWRIALALEQFAILKTGFMEWLTEQKEGLRALRDFLAELVKRNRPLPHLVRTELGLPVKVVDVSHEVLVAIGNYIETGKVENVIVGLFDSEPGSDGYSGEFKLASGRDGS